MKLSKGRVTLGVLIVIVALLFLIAVSWIAALAFLFIVACAVLCSLLIDRATSSAREHGIYRLFGDE